jgi:hypothetical protein
MTALAEEVALLEAEANPVNERVEPLISDAASLRIRIASAMRIAEANEMEALQALAGRLGEVQRRLEILLANVPAHSCDKEVGEAIEYLAERLFKAFRERLSPQEWQRAKSIVTEVTGVRYD